MRMIIMNATLQSMGSHDEGSDTRLSILGCRYSLDGHLVRRTALAESIATLEAKPVLHGDTARR
jgi:hypothetical protein